MRLHRFDNDIELLLKLLACVLHRLRVVGLLLRLL